SMHHPVHGVWAVQLKDAPALPNHDDASALLAGTLLLKPIPASGPELPLQPSGDTEIGWHFHPGHWGTGYAAEAAHAVLTHAFESGLPRVIAVTNPANTPSQRVCTRIGLAHAGQTDKYYNARCELYEASNTAA
ncbi:MAG: GNAT family N-acetyltransferase, partial [Actinomycetes bacterium]